MPKAEILAASGKGGRSPGKYFYACLPETGHQKWIFHKRWQEEEQPVLAQQPAHAEQAPLTATPDLNRCHNSKRAREWETQKASQRWTAGVRVRVTDLSGPQASGVCCTSPHTHLNTHLPSGARTHHIYKTSQQEISSLLKWPGLNKIPLTESSELLGCIK